MDRHGNIDYRMPAKGKDDFRTSTYRGHFRRADCITIPPKVVLEDVCRKFPTKAPRIVDQSEQKREYIWKPTDSDMVRNPTLKTMLHLKPYDDTKLRHAPKPIPDCSSIYQSDFQAKRKLYEEPRSGLPFPAATKPAAPAPISRVKPGYAKLLDPSNTTYNMSYYEVALADLGICTPDAITYWNWQKHKYNVSEVQETMCDRYRTEDCPKRYNEYRTPTEWVPNNGQISITKSSYVDQRTTLNYDITNVKNLPMASMGADLALKTENMLYGIGDNSRRYVP